MPNWCTMRTTVLAVTVFVTIAAVSASRSARQTHYQPSGGAASRGSAAGGYDAYQPQQAQAQSFRPQVQAAPQQSYDQSAYQGQPAPRGRATVQSFGGGLARPTQQSQSQGGQQSQSEEEEEEKPNPLTLLLEKSTFTCSSKTDGYYADNSVNCQVFHYCVAGAKHSWMCPEGTVFHQVHLNCVPASQDICNTAEKFFFVNDYLHKELESRGPNNTVLYAQRYYPEGYVLGDPFPVPSGGQNPRPQGLPQQAQYEPQPQPQAPPRQAFRGQATPRGPPAQFQPQQFQSQAPPQYSSQPAAAPAQFGGAQPSRGSSGSGFGFPPTRTYIIPAPNKAPASDANPSYLYRQGAASNSAQSHQSSVKYDDDY
ncbi:uncharacterized protein [Dermacentor andersoni]|uniref:uncharacterized protein isoform X2 n=1 Tax=Dermacentor andersoni TaxID=34620 RepID=UPI002415B60E|nr:uncharacterized protein LOC126539521 isoform X2 [Dermacentor andersoni]